MKNLYLIILIGFTSVKLGAKQLDKVRSDILKKREKAEAVLAHKINFIEAAWAQEYQKKGLKDMEATAYFKEHARFYPDFEEVVEQEYVFFQNPQWVKEAFEFELLQRKINFIEATWADLHVQEKKTCGKYFENSMSEEENFADIIEETYRAFQDPQRIIKIFHIRDHTTFRGMPTPAQKNNKKRKRHSSL